MGNEKQYILAGWLIDGSGDPIQNKVVLEITGGRITDIAPYNQDDCPPASQTTDFSHCCIVPPLVDGHAHLCMSGAVNRTSREHQLTAGYGELRGIISEHLKHHFSHGVVAVRDGGDRLCSVLRYRQERGQHETLPVIVKSPGAAWYREGRYGSLIGSAVTSSMPLSRRIAESGVDGDHIKVLNSGINSLKEYGSQTAPQFTGQELVDTVEYGRKRGLKVMVHANGTQPVQVAVDAGCHSIEHGYFMGPDNLDQMASKQIFWVPTLYTMKGCLDSIELGMKDADSDVVARMLDHQLQQLVYAKKCGVPVVVGTDAGSIGVQHGESVVDELKLFMSAGYSLAEAISSATWQAARLLEIEDTFGLLTRGRPANFLVARGTPAQLPRKLRFLEAIYLNGRPSEDYRDLLRLARVHRG